MSFLENAVPESCSRRPILEHFFFRDRDVLPSLKAYEFTP